MPSDDRLSERCAVIPDFSRRVPDATLSVIKFHPAFILDVCLIYQSPESPVHELALPPVNK